MMCKGEKGSSLAVLGHENGICRIKGKVSLTGSGDMILGVRNLYIILSTRAVNAVRPPWYLGLVTSVAVCAFIAPHSIPWYTPSASQSVRPN